MYRERGNESVEAGKKNESKKKRQTDPGAAALILPAGVEWGGGRRDLVMAIERW